LQMKSIAPGRVEGAVRAPHSKSVLQRAIAVACLAEGTTRIRAELPCDDDRAAMAAARALGAHVAFEGAEIRVAGIERPTGGIVDCGESGLCLRTFSAIAALYDAEFTMTARGSLARRPVGMIEGPLTSLGARCATAAGRPPITIRGPIRGGAVDVDGSITSQFLSGLLIALPRCKPDSVVRVKGLASAPYVRLTISVLERFGIRIDANDDLTRIAIPGGQHFRAPQIDVEGDWSAAAMLLVAGATSGTIEVRGIDMDSLQADRRIVDALERAGASVSSCEGAVSAAMGDLSAFEFDATDSPDLFPPLAALALSCEGTSEIRGASRLAHKESDRSRALTEELGRLGARIELEGDVMRIHGGQLAGGSASARGDHRIAMALAVAALSAEGPVEIEGDESVAKSYPEFFEDLKKMGARVT
jgi:3-phosphoshikimate 1-carboxyvinyltransferase